MKASFDSAVVPLACVCLLGLATGCWTADARDNSPDASAPETARLCGPSASACFEQVTLLAADGLLVDEARGVEVPLAETFPKIEGGFYPFPGPDLDAGIPNGITRVLTSDPDYPYHLQKNIPSSAGFSMNWHFPTYPNPAPTCLDAAKSTAGAVIDASKYDGIFIEVFGDAGPPGNLTLAVSSVGAAGDPSRTQELEVTFKVPSAPTTFHFLWSDMIAKCGSRNDFNPSKLTTLRGAFLALAGIAYKFDVVVGRIGFIPKTQ